MLRKFKDSSNTLTSIDNSLRAIENSQNPLQTLPRKTRNSNRLRKHRTPLT